MGNTNLQAKFYDSCPPLVPWPNLLKNYGFYCLYKPREVFWKKALDSLRLEPQDKVLEVGCGQGLFLARIVKHYKVKGVGIDVSKKSIAFAKSKYGNRALSFKCANATKLPFKNALFNCVLSFDVLEHIEDQEKAISEMMRVLAPGGKILIYTLSKNYSYTLDWVWEKIGINIYSRAAHDPRLFLDISTLKKKIKENDGTKIKTTLFDSFFTLAVDEGIMSLVALFKKLDIKNQNFGRIFLFSCNYISKFLFPAINLVDSIWYNKKQSLSFSITAEKNEEKT